LWTSISRELHERGCGYKESGGFLLGHDDGNCRIIETFIPYDDIDPFCLRGVILFDGSKMDQVWDICRSQGLQVVADVHTHPGVYIQSYIDKENPMIPERGHIALIIPNYSDRTYMPGEIGIYEFCGGTIWKDHSALGGKFFAVGRFS
jgi:proteasome lid subunit RPN8/RPN11